MHMLYCLIYLLALCSIFLYSSHSAMQLFNDKNWFRIHCFWEKIRWYFFSCLFWRHFLCPSSSLNLFISSCISDSHLSFFLFCFLQFLCFIFLHLLCTHALQLDLLQCKMQTLRLKKYNFLKKKRICNKTLKLRSQWRNEEERCLEAYGIERNNTKNV